MEEIRENKMGNTPMLRLIISMSLPAIFSMLVQSLYNIVDSYFVSKISMDALTAVSLAFPIQQLMIAMAVGTGVGINSLVSRRLGEKRQREADLAACHGAILAFFTSLLFALFGLFGSRWFLGLFTQNANVIDLGTQYLSVVCICSFGSFVEIAFEKTLQATGNMIYPMLFMLVGCVTNIILDPILIFGLFGLPKMGILGAAVATVTGQILAMCYSLYVVFRKSHAVDVTYTTSASTAPPSAISTPWASRPSSCSPSARYWWWASTAISSVLRNGRIGAGRVLQAPVVCVHAGIWPDPRSDAHHGLQLRRTQKGPRLLTA